MHLKRCAPNFTGGWKSEPLPSKERPEHANALHWDAITTLGTWRAAQWTAPRLCLGMLKNCPYVCSHFDFPFGKLYIYFPTLTNRKLGILWL